MSMLEAVLKAAGERWASDETLATLVEGRVFDGPVSDDTPRPLIRMGGQTEAPANAFGHTGWSNTLTADIFSTHKASLEALTILKAMHEAVKDPLLLEGFGMARLKPEFTGPLIERDGTRHTVVRYRIFAMEST